MGGPDWRQPAPRAVDGWNCVGNAHRQQKESGEGGHLAVGGATGGWCGYHDMNCGCFWRKNGTGVRRGQADFRVTE